MEENGSSGSDEDVEASWRAEEAAADFEQRRSEEAMAEEAAAVALAEDFDRHFGGYVGPIWAL